MTITIPIWLLWIVGISIGLPVLIFMIVGTVFGAQILWSFIQSGFGKR